jgi:hypothetical protein
MGSWFLLGDQIHWSTVPLTNGKAEFSLLWAIFYIEQLDLNALGVILVNLLNCRLKVVADLNPAS